MNWKYPIAIPSYCRAVSIQKKTLHFLIDKMQVPRKFITVFVANEDQWQDYAIALAGWIPPAQIVVAEPGVNRARNFIQKHYAAGTELIYIDDDVRDLIVRHPGITMQTPRREQSHRITPVEFRKLCDRGFALCRKQELRLWGVYPTSNPLHMRDRVFYGLTYIVAAFFGMVVTHDPKVYTRYPVKEDHERSLRYFIQDGGVCRIESVGIETCYFGGTGGLHANGVEERHRWANQYIDKLCAEFPDYCTVLQRKKYRDVKLRRTPMVQ